MRLWILSQDKSTIIKVKDVEGRTEIDCSYHVEDDIEQEIITKKYIVVINEWRVMGRYKSEERLLEIGNEIHKALIDNNCNIYEMPQQ